MKAGVAANLAVRTHAARRRGSGSSARWRVHAVIGEEDGGLGAFATLRRGHRGDAAVITEPTGAQLITATAGALTFRIEVTGRSAHGSMRKEGVSAWEAFLPVYAALVAARDRAQQQDRPGLRRRGALRPVVRHRPGRRVVELRAGQARRRGPLRRADRRGPPGGPDRVRGRRQRGRGEGPLAARPPARGDLAGRAVRQRLARRRPPARRGDDRGRDASGGAPPEQTAGVYGSDLRLYTGIGGVPTLHYGPGDFRLAHAPMERVELDELVQVTRALVVLALRRCGVRQ